MFYEGKKNFEEVIKRRRDFHEGKMKNRILFSVEKMRSNPLKENSDNRFKPTLNLPSTGERVDDVPDINILVSVIEHHFSQFNGIEDDKLQMSEFLNYFGTAFMCEVFEHPVKRIAVGGITSSVVEEHLDDIEQAMKLEYNENSPSVCKIAKYFEDGRKYAGNRWFLSPHLMSDGLHTLTQLFGYEKAYMFLYDKPDDVHRFSRKVLDATKKFFDMQYEIIGQVAGGWICNRSDWNPVRCLSINLDDYLCCSNEILQEFGLPYMQEAIDYFGCGLIHYHTPDTRLLAEVKKLRNIKIQIGSDPKLPEPIETFDKIKDVLGDDIPITWMRIQRDDFVKKLKNKELYGNTEYFLSGLHDIKDANELYEMAKEYIAY